MKLPKHFYHHAPLLHLAFICRESATGTIHFFQCDPPDFETGATHAALNMVEHGASPTDKVVFLGYAV